MKDVFRGIMLRYFTVWVFLSIGRIPENFAEDTEKYEIIGTEIYESVRLLDDQSTSQLQNIWKVHSVEFKGACYDAKRKSKIKDFHYTPLYFEPEIQHFEFINAVPTSEEVSDQMQKLNLNVHRDTKGKDEDNAAKFGSVAIYCGTLPSVYIRIAVSQAENLSKKLLKAVTIRSPISLMKAIEETAIAKAVHLENHPTDKLENHPLVKMNLEDRRSLCSAIIKGYRFTYFSNHVPEARVYELELPAKTTKDITVGILCPVVPITLLHQKDESSPLIRLSLEPPTEGYTYGGLEVITLSRHSENPSEEKIRDSTLSRDYQTSWSLCLEAKKFLNKEHLVRVHDKHIGKTRLYSFIYEDKSEKEWVAVQCCEDPTMYIRINEPEKEIVVMLFTSTANKPNDNVLFPEWDRNLMLQVNMARDVDNYCPIVWVDLGLPYSVSKTGERSS